MPGSRIPVVSPPELLAQNPDDVVILPWNLSREIADSMVAAGYRGRLWVAVPTMRDVTPGR